MFMKYRLYVDESGTSKYSKSDNIKERYLCLTGIIISEDTNSFFDISWKELKKKFTQDSDFPAIFHYTDVISSKGVFLKLKDEKFCLDFNSSYLSVLENTDFKIISVVLDKKTHFQKYGQSAWHPYHYCFNVLLERYVNFLNDNNGVGDILVESRNPSDNNQLSNAFDIFYKNGTDFLKIDIIKRRLTSKNIKFKTKEAGISGLELADMLATPIKFLILYKYKIIEELSNNFTKKVLETVYSKIRKGGPLNKIKGFGLRLIK